MDARHGVAGALTALALLLPSAARSNCKIQSVVLPVTMVGMRPIVTVRINGTNVPMLADSGAAYSILTEAAATQLKLSIDPTHGRVTLNGLGGVVDASMTTVHKLELLGGDVPDVDFLVGGTEPGSGAMGIIGRNILSVADTEYDLAHGVIRLVFPGDECGDTNMAYWAGKQPVSVVELLHDRQDRLKRPAILGDVTVDGKTLHAMFDSGADSSVMALRAAHAIGLREQDMALASSSYGVDGKELTSWTTQFAKIEVGGEVIANNRLRVADLVLNHDMLLGVDFFLSHHLYVSKKRRLMFLTYNGGRIFAGNIAGPLGTADTASAAAPGSSAAGEAALDADAYARRGAASASRGDPATALADLDRAIALAPASAALLTQRAGIHLQLKQEKEALADVDQALQIDPLQTGARLLRANLRARARDNAGALGDLAELDGHLAPEAVQRMQMGMLYLQLYQPAPALAEFDQWIPHHLHESRIEQVRYVRCWARIELNTALEQAFDDCDAAVDADPKNATFLGGRAWVSLRQGKAEKARRDFDRSLAIQPNSALELFGRGLAELRLGDASASQADLDAARKQSRTIDADMVRFGFDKERAGQP